jgi:uncharacterized RDD family membrane protein YckC
MEHLTIETPEQIPLEFSLAGIGSRFLALALDTLIQFAVALLLVIIGLLIFAVVSATVPRQGMWVLAAYILLAFVLQFGYFAVFEAIENGQTPGKRHLHLRVIKDDGRPITVYDSVARNLLRIVDTLPGFYAVGILSMLISPQNKRLGDYVAGTVVIHERPLELPGSAGPSVHPQEPEPESTVAPASMLNLNTYRRVPKTVPAPEGPSGYNVRRLSVEEFGLMEAFLSRRGQLKPDVRSQMARKIADRIAPALKISAQDLARAEALLEKLVDEYRK